MNERNKSQIVITMNDKKPPASVLNFLLLLLLLVSIRSQVECQSSQSSSSTATTTAPPAIVSGPNRTTSERLSIITSSTTTEPPPPPTTTSSSQVEPTTTSGEVLLSGNEFVDFTEAPILLFDGLSNERAPDNGSTTDKNTNETSSLQVPSTTTIAPTGTITLPPPTIVADTSAIGTGNGVATSGPDSAANATTTPNSDEPATVGEPDSGGGGDDTPASDDYEPIDEAKEATKQTFDPPKNVSQYMDYIERLFHDLRHQITDLFEPHIPQLIRTSQMVELSGSCSYDMLRMALALRQFEPWALRMIDSSGKVPEGIFEGSFTALGSYDECLSTVFSSSSSRDGTSASGGGGSGGHQSATGNQQHSSQPLTQGKYCLVNVSPFLPPKPSADRVELMFQEEADRRNYSKDDQFSRLSPMFYYMKFRIGVCIPSTCMESDMESISNALSSSLRLNITIPHCRVKQDQPITRHQFVGGLIFGLVLVAVLSATLMDYWRRKLDRLTRRDSIIVLDVAANEKSVGAAVAGNFHPVLLSNCDFKANLMANDLKGSALSSPSGYPLRAGSFNELFRKHWSWMSFSLLTNYKLYFTNFQQAPSLQPPGHQLNMENHHRQQPAPIIRCLNGIRVLSLCWVIVANSYITLDPRATKRLTKTREAPKDFLFQLVAQASLAIETFFFLSGILVSMSFARKLNPVRTKEPEVEELPGSEKSHEAGDATTHRRQPSYLLQWVHFYVHRYIRMTPATMLVIAFTMFAFRYGDGPLWFEATHKAHMSCSENWWRHLLHVANFIDTRQMCFIHYWYIAADMQLFLFAPVLLLLVYQRRRIGYAIATLIGLASMGFVFYNTYIRNLPPTLLFYNSDPESRREFGNTIMTKPLTHALPYMVGMLVGKWLTTRQAGRSIAYQQPNRSLATLLGSVATMVALAEVFLPYKWNNSRLPTRFMAALYAAVFRFCWSLALAYLVIACAHPPGRRCRRDAHQHKQGRGCSECCHRAPVSVRYSADQTTNNWNLKSPPVGLLGSGQAKLDTRPMAAEELEVGLCLCGSGGNIVNRLLSLDIFTSLSKLSFVAYLIHLPLMSVFIAQTRGLFAFSHTLVIHLALSYLVMTFMLSFVLVHIIEFPFLTFERYLFERLFYVARHWGTKRKSAEERDHRTKVNGGHITGAANASGATDSINTIRRSANDGGENNRQHNRMDYATTANAARDAGRSENGRRPDRINRVNQVVGLSEGGYINSNGSGYDTQAKTKPEAASFYSQGGGETFRISERL